MPKTVIVFGENTLVTALPQDSSIQEQLVTAGLVFNADGEPVRTMPHRGLLPSDFYCIPFAGLTKLLFAMTEVLKNKGLCEIEFAFADAVYVDNDAQRRSVLSRCLNAVFGENMPRSFGDAYWQSNRDGGDTLVGFSQAGYHEEVSRLSIDKQLEDYRAIKDATVKLPDAIAYFYLDTSNAEKFDAARVALKSRIDGMQQDTTRQVLLQLNLFRLQKSVMSLLSAIKKKHTADRLVFVTSNAAHRRSAEELRIETIYTGNIVQNILENQQAPCLLSINTTQFLASTILRAVGSPFSVFSAYMTLLKDHPVELGHQYFGAHLFINHLVFIKAFQQTSTHNHHALSEAFRLMSNALAKMDPNEMLAEDQMQRHVEYLVFRFAAFFRGKLVEQRVPLASIIPQEVITEFRACQQLGDDPDRLARVFLMWCSSQLQLIEEGTQGGLFHFVRELRQLASSYTEKLGLIERISASMGRLSAVLLGEIARLSKPGDLRANLDSVAEGLLPRTPTARSRDEEFKTPVRATKKAGLRFEGDSASNGRPLSRTGSVGSAAGGLDFSIRLEDLMDLSLNDKEQQHVRVETFSIPQAISVRDFLETRVRLSRRPNRNVSLVYADREEGADLRVAAIVYHDLETGTTVYYRRDIKGDDNKKLRENGPLTHLPILLVKVTPLGAQQEIKVLWAVSLAEVYIGKENALTHSIPDMIPRDLYRTESALLGKLYEKLSAASMDSSLKPFTAEILTAVHNIGLTEKERDFLSLNVSTMGGSPVIRQLVEDMQTVCKFVNQQQMPGLFSFAVTPTGIKAKIDSKGQKLLSMWSLFLNAANVVALLPLIFGFHDTVIPISSGDKFFYLNNLNTQLIRAAILIVYVSAPFDIAKQLTGYLFKLVAQARFGRTLTNLPRDIPAAIASGSLSQQTVAAKLSHSLEFLAGVRQADLPLEAREFLAALRGFAEMSEHSKLPATLRVLLMGPEGIANKVVAGPDDRSPEQLAIEAIQQAQKTYLRGTGSVAVAAAVLASVFAGVYYSLINTNEGENELSPLTRAAVYALGVSALFLLYRFGSSVAESSVSFAAHRKASFFGDKRPVVDELPLRGIRVVNDGDAGNDPDAERRPLLKNAR